MGIGWLANQFDAPDYQILAATGPVVSGMGFVTYISETINLLGGTYDLRWTVVGLCTQAGAAFGAQVLLGGTPVPTATETSAAAPAATSRMVVTSAGNYTHSGGLLTVLVQLRREAGTGNVTPQAASLVFRRVA